MRDYNAYLKGMEKSMAEKLFFLPYLEKVQNEVVYLIDFGCASGEMLSRIPDMPDMQKIGIDHDSNMLKIARSKTKGTFYSSLDEFLENEKPSEKTCAIVFSSVLHEVGSDYEEIKAFVKKYCTYVFIRDMYIAVDDFNFREDFEKVVRYCKPNQLADFIKYQGIPTTERDLYHFLLKYTYVESWDLEVKEKYTSVPWVDIMTTWGKVIYNREYLLSFKRDSVMKDFCIEMDGTTHRQVVIKVGEEDQSYLVFLGFCLPTDRKSKL